MGKKKKHKKSGSKKQLPTEYILFATALIELIEILMEIIKKLTEQGMGQKPLPKKEYLFQSSLSI